MPERLYRLTVEYDGTGYAGFQRQPGEGPPSIQGTLEEALGRLVDHPVHVLGAGRTDAGVHATGQVVAFRTSASRSLEVLVRGANALLPPDIRVLEAAETPEGFHPRFSALSRTYRYLVLPREAPEALFRHRAWQVHGALDLERMNQAGSLLLGRHDFSSYCAQVPARDTRVRTLLALEATRWPGPGPAPWERLGGLVALRVRADAFLRRMVRMLAAVLVGAGQGRWEPEEARRILDRRDPGACPPPAPPWGLYLVDVEYPEAQDSFGSGKKPRGLREPPGAIRHRRSGMANDHETALVEAGEKLGQAMQNAPDAERDILRAMYEKLNDFASSQEGKGQSIDRSAFFAAGIIAHEKLQSEALIQAATEYIDRDYMFCRSRKA